MAVCNHKKVTKLQTLCLIGKMIKWLYVTTKKAYHVMNKVYHEHNTEYHN